MIDSYTLAVGSGTLTSVSDTSMIDDTLVVDDNTLAVGGGARTVDASTLTVGIGTLTSVDQHQLDGAIASTT
jgi:hypothetical protein